MQHDQCKQQHRGRLVNLIEHGIQQLVIRSPGRQRDGIEELHPMPTEIGCHVA